ncbi:MAG: DUF4230 domain-containing protein [Lachnospiraceae bacterium]|nr:DUF4230 domain-containing protein [Lachnospiraceae bacterium]
MRRNKEEKRTTADFFKTAFMMAGAILVALFLGGLIMWFYLGGNKPADISAEFVESRIEKVAKLTTAEMTYRGMIRYTDGDIPLLTRKHVNAMYEAQINVGIDASQITYDMTDKELIIRLPKAKLLDEVNILPDSLRYYDKQTSILNQIDEEDVTEILKKAQEDAQLHANVEGVIAEADANAKDLIETLFPKELLGERTLVITSLQEE